MKSEKSLRLYKGYAIVLTGLTLAEITIAYKIDYNILQIVFYVALGIAASLFGLFYYLIPIYREKPDDMAFFDTQWSNNGLSSPKLQAFRKDMSNYYSTKGIAENDAMQSATTQYYKNILDLKKKRLDKLGVKMEFNSERRRYTKNPVRSKKYFDGKYEINEVDEELESLTKYSKDDTSLLVRHQSGLAHYTMINACQTGEDEVVCPNCGNPSTRENLMDGCDYCDTKFTVEDLGEKVSDFSIQDDYEIAYAKYKDKRGFYLSKAAAIFFSISYIIVVLSITLLMFDEEERYAQDPDPASPLILLIGFVAISAIAAIVMATIAMLFYTVSIFPMIEIGASLKYNSEKKLDALKKSMDKSQIQEQKVKSFDPLFSVNSFFSNIQNKLFAVIFSNKSGEYEEFKNVIDYDVESMEFTDYRVENGFQNADVAVSLKLYTLSANKINESTQKFKLQFIKSADCKTKAICSPSIMRCRGCGATLSIENNYVCSFCGNKVDLKMFDWEMVK